MSNEDEIYCSNCRVKCDQSLMLSCDHNLCMNCAAKNLVRHENPGINKTQFIICDICQEKTEIDKQFQYNQYIRDFFKDNDDKTLKDAIKCWNYKKSLKGHNKYEKSDLDVLN